MSYDETISTLEKVNKSLTELINTVAEIRQLVGPFAVPLGPNELLVQTIHSLKYVIPTNDLVMTPQLVVYRQWEPDLSALLPQLSPPGSVFVDVGANFGYFSCLVAARMAGHPSSKVIAIEPNPELVRLLEMNVKINWSMSPVQIESVAVGECNSEMQLTVPGGRFANGTLTALPATVASGNKSYPVSVVTLDEILEKEPVVNLLKVDVEGHEMAVFRGAKDTLCKRNASLVFEWSLPQTHEAGYDPNEIVDFLHMCGYKIYNITEHGGFDRNIPLSRKEITQINYANFVCLK
jgi:FkbM family methyltransferase